MAQRVPPGLAGVVVADTGLGGVRGDEGFFHYRQYSALDLARHRSLEDVWYLLHAGRLPSSTDAEEFRSRLVADRHLSEEIMELLGRIGRAAPQTAPALAWVRTGLSLVANSAGMQSWIGRDDVSAEVRRLAAALPTIVATMWRARADESPVAPRDDLSAAANFLWMLEAAEPEATRARALEQYLILTVDHGFNASTFASRVVASTGSDVGGAMASGLAALSGPLHGGAPTLVVEMLKSIADAEHARAWARTRLASGEVIMGFGHRVYRTEDPRSELLREVAMRLGGPLVDLAIDVQPILLNELQRHRPDREIRTNVEFFAGVVLHELGIPPPLYPAAFAVSRIIGWAAHILEQISENRIIRPSSVYVGPQAPAPL